MKRSRTLPVLLLAPLFAGGFLLRDATSEDGPRLFGEVLSLVSDRYVDTLTAAALYEKAARGLVEELNDPYADLFTPAQLREFNKTTGGRYAGIGLLIEDVRGVIRVNTVYPKTPAEQGGVQTGDRVVQVDSIPTRGLSLTKVSSMLLGTPGTKVRVLFSRPGVPEPIEMRLTRAVVHIPAVPYALLVGGDVGYIPVQQFNETAAREVSTAVVRLTREGARGLVLDLRGNGGGYLDQALVMSNLFLPKGAPLLSVRYRGAPAEEVEAERDAQIPSIPLVVLTDEGTASASEIVAGALQDHDRALIVGTTSFGKGLVQSLFPLEGGYALKMTTGKWFTPSGRSIHKDRKFVEGRFVEEASDSLETEAVKKDRPVYKSDAGRTVYGGGAITPDVIVPEDTVSTGEQQLFRALAPKSAELFGVLSQYAVDLQPGARPAAPVTDAMREELFTRLKGAGVAVDRAQWDAGRASVDRLLRRRVLQVAFGDSTAKRVELEDDAQFRTALRALRNARTQRELFAAAPSAPSESR
jgi:carboxyl-terminal processing protease